MDLAKYVVTKISDAVNNPYTVRLCSSLDYKASILVQNDWHLSLYFHKEAYDCVLANPFVNNQDFRLFRIQLAKKAEAFTLFKTFCHILPQLLTDETKQCLEVSKLQNLCDVIKDNLSWSIAHIVVKSGIIDFAKKELLGKTIHSQLCTKHMSPLHLACDLKQLDILKQLCEIAQKFDLKDDNGETIFHYAVSKCPIEFIKYLCNEPKFHAALNAVNEKLEAPLHVACSLNKFEFVNCLLNANADTKLCSKTGYPIHHAMKNNTSLPICTALLDKDPSLAGKLCALHKATPMHWCQNHEHVILLKKFSPNMNIQSSDGHVPLHVMVLKNRLDAAMSMILCGTDINCRGRNNNTALHLSVQIDDVELVKMLLLFGADCNVTNDFGEAPGLLFMRSTKPNKDKIIELLSSIGGIILDK